MFALGFKSWTVILLFEFHETQHECVRYEEGMPFSLNYFHRYGFLRWRVGASSWPKTDFFLLVSQKQFEERTWIDIKRFSEVELKLEAIFWQNFQINFMVTSNIKLHDSVVSVCCEFNANHKVECDTVKRCKLYVQASTWLRSFTFNRLVNVFSVL